MPAFIETQFPIARLSAESYKERKANNSQTLTRLGKWWGRKPLILVRASILGMLMPASGDPKRDREIFLKLLTMDDEGLLERWRADKRFSLAELRSKATPEEGEKLDQLLEERALTREKWQTLRRINKTSPSTQQAAKSFREAEDAFAEYESGLQRRCFMRSSYPERIARCVRPEHLEGPTPEAWGEINAHLGTTASSLSDLMDELGRRMFGHRPRVGDSFCGGGSIPFEAARIGCDAFGSDLNPVAGLLTWASLNLLGGGEEVQKEVMRVQEEVLAAADQQVTAWGIEHNEEGERADAFLYCVEVKPEGCDYFIPLAPSWLVGEKSKVICRWQRIEGKEQLQPEITTVSDAEVRAYKGGKEATAVRGRVIDPFDTKRSWSMESLRGEQGLRRWTNDDLVPRDGDIFQERLYCIRWVKTVTGKDGKIREIRRYAAPTAADLEREAKILELINACFCDWQSKGFIPSRGIPENGIETARLARERGWTHWHHLFTPRQLLTHGLIAQISEEKALSREAKMGCLLGLGRLANWNSRLCAWMPHSTNEKGDQVFYNQALNCHYTYAGRATSKLEDTFSIIFEQQTWEKHGPSLVEAADARTLSIQRDIWLTDPPYADAVNYHELGDFFLAWHGRPLSIVFPDWTPDARAELAVRGDGEDFRRSMVEVYQNLARHMPDNGFQMVMFTHQNPAVWADLGMILWAAGLKATAAWTISTETDAVGIKKGNYVQGTVCLVLRKRIEAEPGFLDEVYPLVEDEVRRQIVSMQALDEGDEPNFNDADYQLAAYAAALKVLTRYGTLDGRDVEHELFAVRNERSDFQDVIERAITVACDLLIPRGLESHWRELSLVERYYLRALDIESRGERRKGMYEELARGFGVSDVKSLLNSDKANGARMHTPTGFGSTHLDPVEGVEDALPLTQRGARATSPRPFAAAPLRHLFFAIGETTRNDGEPERGRQYLRDTFGQSYWQHRERFVTLLEWLTLLGNAEGMSEWEKDAQSSRILAGRLRNDEA